MNQIEMLNKLKMIDPTDQAYKPVQEKEQVSWTSTLEVLRNNPSPQAQALYAKMLKKYNLVDN